MSQHTARLPYHQLANKAFMGLVNLSETIKKGSIGARLADRLHGEVATDVETGEQVALQNGALLSADVAIPGKYVRTFTIASKEQS